MNARCFLNKSYGKRRYPPLCPQITAFMFIDMQVVNDAYDIQRSALIQSASPGRFHLRTTKNPKSS